MFRLGLTDTPSPPSPPLRLLPLSMTMERGLGGEALEGGRGGEALDGTRAEAAPKPAKVRASPAVAYNPPSRQQRWAARVAK
jgi:hypothetical protein